MNRNRYLIEIFWSDEDSAYVAVVPDLPGCSAVGETEEQALKEVHDAIDAWIAACRAAGDPVPVPRKRPIMVA